jgi:hypothetical protein
MNTQDPIEQALRRYRPAAPSATLRQRVLVGMRASSRSHAGSWRPGLFWFAIAAALIVAAGLHKAAQDLTLGTTRCVGVGLVEWDDAAEQAADLLGGDLQSRRYIALGLMAGDDPSTSSATWRSL